MNGGGGGGDGGVGHGGDGAIVTFAVVTTLVTTSSGGILGFYTFNEPTLKLRLFLCASLFLRVDCELDLPEE